MHTVTVDEAKNRLPDLIEEALRGDEVVIRRDDQTAVRLAPVPPSPSLTRPQFGSARGLITMADDFDEPLDDFAEYMP